MLRVVLQYLPLLAFLIALLFFVRLLCALFSRKIQDQMRRHRTLHCLWGCWALTTACFLYLLLSPELLT
jgi:hypothetical protein